MTDYGLTTSGFVAKTLSVLKGELEDSFRNEFDQNIPTNADSVTGQLIGIMSDRLASVWDLASALYANNSLLGASGTALDERVALASITRNAATFSSVILTLSGTPATSIPSGTKFSDGVTTWTTQTSAVLDGGGSALVEAFPSVTGPINALTGTVTTIVTPVFGLSSVINTEDAEPGRNVESDASLRQRFLRTFRAGSGGINSILAYIYRVSGVTEAFVIENNDAETDSEGRPPKSFEAVVRGGTSQDIADAIWAVKPAGIESYGTTSVTVTDSIGNTHTVKYSPPDLVNVYFTVTVTPELDEDGNDLLQSDAEELIEQAILDYGQTFTIGQDVFPFKFIQRIDIDHIKDISIAVGRFSSPTSTEPVGILRKELAVIDSANISVVRT